MREFFDSVLQFFGDVWAFFKGCYDFLMHLFTVMLPDLMAGCADTLTGVISTLTGVLSLDFGSITFAGSFSVGLINVFFPVTEFVTMVSAILTLLACMMGVKWVLKILPTIG